MDKKKRKYAVIICVCVLMALTAAGVAVLYYRAGKSRNLALQKGVAATCDSTENEALSADRAIDGNDTDLSSRWSSENNREDASHYIELEFPEEISVSFVVLKWERRNVVNYTLEGALDSGEWTVLKSFDSAPEEKEQEIALEEPVRVRRLRLVTHAVSKNEADYSNLYQNVSLYEFEVYADKPAAYHLGKASVGTDGDGGRFLVMPEALQGYEVTYLGADYEQVIDGQGRIYPTIEDKEVTVGFRVAAKHNPSDVREIAQTLTVPAYDQEKEDRAETEEVQAAEEQERQFNDCPDVIPALAEWKGGQGRCEIGAAFRVIVEEGGTLQETAQLFADKYREMTRCQVTIASGSVEDVQSGDIYLGYADEEDGLGEEGYTCDITDRCIIKGGSDTGVRWGTVTLLQILSVEGSLPRGQIRDYPLYEVRGFGIDVARKAVSMDMLYAMMEKMSYYKMNDLAIHLNDNTILSTSGLTDSVENAMTAESAFRLESDIINESGMELTSKEYAYTKEEFAQFVKTAKTYGVRVVPEIDTPAHSLSITKLYPSYALTARPDSVDQIDLSNKDAVALVKRIWQEALSGENAPFRDASTVNIGMDEYYGDGEQYRVYASEMAELVRGEGKTVRMWGSLSNMAGRTMPAAGGTQMNLWSTLWADPREMYEAGYSLINMQNNHLYVIPGGGYDYLDKKELFTEWSPGRFYDYNTSVTLPSYSPQMLGAAYMIWNDMSGNLDLGISEYDLYVRFQQPLGVLAAKLWGMEDGPEGAQGSGEEAEAAYEAFCSLEEQIDGVSYGREGRQNRIYDAGTGLEPTYEVNMRLFLEEDAGTKTADAGTDTADGETNGQQAAQIIAESDSAYGRWAFYAVEPETGQVGFCREGKTYTWDYTLPRGRWVELKVVGEPGKTTLYADGVKVGTLGNTKPFEEYSTFVFPVQRLGEETGAFRGEFAAGAGLLP